MTVKIYLAGPDVFLPNAREVGERKRAMCAEFGFEGLFPFDAESPGDPAAIFESNCALMRRADLGVFNLTPFRGPSADVGTAFELGFMFAQGKPVYGYSSTPADYRTRVEALIGVAQRDARVWAGDRMAVEDFGLGDNLMLDRAIARSGGGIMARRADDDVAAFTAFRACLEGVPRTGA